MLKHNSAYCFENMHVKKETRYGDLLGEKGNSIVDTDVKMY